MMTFWAVVKWETVSSLIPLVPFVTGFNRIEQVFLPGAPVHAVHEDGDWPGLTMTFLLQLMQPNSSLRYDATIVDVDGSKQKVSGLSFATPTGVLEPYGCFQK